MDAGEKGNINENLHPVETENKSMWCKNLNESCFLFSAGLNCLFTRGPAANSCDNKV